VLVKHPAELERLDERAVLDVAPDAAWRALAATLLAAPADALTDCLDELEGEARRRCSELMNDPAADLDDAAKAPTIFGDALAKLQKIRRDREKKQLTARIAAGESDLSEKQRQIERSLGSPTG
jgi:hypothetical protein